MRAHREDGVVLRQGRGELVDAGDPGEDRRAQVVEGAVGRVGRMLVVRILRGDLLLHRRCPCSGAGCVGLFEDVQMRVEAVREEQHGSRRARPSAPGSCRVGSSYHHGSGIIARDPPTRNSRCLTIPEHPSEPEQELLRL